MKILACIQDTAAGMYHSGLYYLLYRLGGTSMKRSALPDLKLIRCYESLPEHAPIRLGILDDSWPVLRTSKSSMIGCQPYAIFRVAPQLTSSNGNTTMPEKFKRESIELEDDY